MTLRKSAPGQVGRGRLSLSKKSFRQAEARRYGGVYPLPSVARREKRGFHPPFSHFFPLLTDSPCFWREFFDREAPPAKPAGGASLFFYSSQLCQTLWTSSLSSSSSSSFAILSACSWSGMAV